MSSGAVSTNGLQYTGREHDANDLYYYRFRFYSNRLQRFLSEDPAGFQGGDVNLYAYVSNAPTRFSDPLGLWLPGDHWNQTVEAALACGLSAINAYQLAWSNVMEDSNLFSWFDDDDPIHAMPDTNYGPIVTMAMNNAVSTQNWPAALSYLGSGLHTVQDKWAHDLNNPRGSIENHRNRPGGFSPDDPKGNPFNFWASRKDTEIFIADFMRARGMKPRCQN
jgi:RHS repeat-associated protein